MKEKDPYQQPERPAVVIPPAQQTTGPLVRAENENPRANENLRDGGKEEQTAANTVGSEITDGEDG